LQNDDEISKTKAEECLANELSSFNKDCTPVSDDYLLNRIAQFESKIEALQALKPNLYEAIVSLEDKDESSTSDENASTSSDEQ